MEHWDPFTHIEATRTLTVDVDAVREACQLGADSAFAVVASDGGTTARHSDEGTNGSTSAPTPVVLLASWS